MNFGVFSFAANWIRAYLIEAIYRRLGMYRRHNRDNSTMLTGPLATMFPETENWLTPADE